MKTLLKAILVCLLLTGVAVFYGTTTGCGGGGGTDATIADTGDTGGDAGGGSSPVDNGGTSEQFTLPTTPAEMATLASTELVQGLLTPQLELFSALNANPSLSADIMALPSFDASAISIVSSRTPDPEVCNCGFPKPPSCVEAWWDGNNCSVIASLVDLNGDGLSAFDDTNCRAWLEAVVLGWPAHLKPQEDAMMPGLPETHFLPYQVSPMMIAAMDHLGDYDFIQGTNEFRIKQDVEEWRLASGIMTRAVADLNAFDTGTLGFTGAGLGMQSWISVFADDQGKNRFYIPFLASGFDVHLSQAAEAALGNLLAEKLLYFSAEGTLQLDEKGITNIVFETYFIQFTWQGKVQECYMNVLYGGGALRCTESAAATVEICNNGIDDDGDGLADCSDICPLDPVSCCSNYYACGGTETICNDVMDNDGDGKIDCDDPDCADDPSCTVTTQRDCSCLAAPERVDCGGVENCSNTVDDNADGRSDCMDYSCKWRTFCQDQPAEVICDDWIDNDHDGYIDCADLDCYNYYKDMGDANICNEANHVLYPANSCTDGIDNDHDAGIGSTSNGAIDCEDIDCCSEPICIETNEACANLQ